ncbi:UNVERIFIED_CONTAM: ogfod2 [Trichonephila clavipes]
MIKNLAARMSFYNCDCFITHNIYVQELNRHFKFIDTNQFFKDYGEILSKLGYHTNSEKNCLLKEITGEINRRKNLEKHSLERKKLLQQMYKPMETNVFNLQVN